MDMTCLVSVINSTSLGATVTGGSAAGVEMETELPWLAIGFTEPASLGFHISSSNGANLPNKLDDNMEGPNGGAALVFGDVGLTKTASPVSTGVGRTANFLLQVDNFSTRDAASNIVVEDALVAQGFAYVSDDSSTTGTSYDAVTSLWQIPSSSAGQNVVLTLVVRQLVAVEETRNNLAVHTDPGLIDIKPGNDGDTAAVTFVDGLAIAKSVETVSDPVTGTVTPKMIPGAYVDYFIDVENPSSGTPIDISVDDVLPGEVALWVVALPGLSEPFEFIDGGVSGAPSGISFSFDTLASIIDSVAFSNNGGVSFSYTPIADANGLDANVTNIRFILSGTFLASGALPNPA